MTTVLDAMLASGATLFYAGLLDKASSSASLIESYHMEKSGVRPCPLEQPSRKNDGIA